MPNRNSKQGKFFFKLKLKGSVPEAKKEQTEEEKLERNLALEDPIEQAVKVRVKNGGLTSTVTVQSRGAKVVASKE